jgi:hypothetical protein
MSCKQGVVGQQQGGLLKHVIPVVDLAKCTPCGASDKHLVLTCISPWKDASAREHKHFPKRLSRQKASEINAWMSSPWIKAAEALNAFEKAHREGGRGTPPPADPKSPPISITSQRSCKATQATQVANPSGAGPKQPQPVEQGWCEVVRLGVRQSQTER